MVVDFSRAHHRMAGRGLPVVTSAELAGIGLTRAQIRHRATRGPLYRVHRGVFFIGSPNPTLLAHQLAAVLACSYESAISHLGAAAHWKMLDVPARPIDVTVPGIEPRRPGIRIHRVRELHPDDRWVSVGVPFTSPSRTLIDIAALASADALEEAVDAARRLRLATPASIGAAIGRVPRRLGVGRLKALMDELGHTNYRRSFAERELPRLFRAAAFPPWLVNEPVLGMEIDIVWKDLCVGVEVDSAAWHTSAQELDRDRDRDEILRDAGWRIVRVTARQLARRPHVVVRRVAAAHAEAALELRLAALAA